MQELVKGTHGINDDDILDVFGFCKPNNGQGFISLANAYQHAALEDTAHQIERNASFLERVMNFITHLQTEEHFDNEAHQRNLGHLESSFHANCSGKQDLLMLGLRLSDMGRSCSAPF